MKTAHETARSALQDGSADEFDEALEDCTDFEVRDLICRALAEQKPDLTFRAANELDGRGQYNDMLVNALIGATNPPAASKYGTGSRSRMIRRLYEQVDAPLPLTAKRLYDLDLDFKQPRKIVKKLLKADLTEQALEIVQENRDTIRAGQLTHTLGDYDAPKLVSYVMDLILERDDIKDRKASRLSSNLGEYGNLSALKTLAEKGITDDFDSALGEAVENGQRETIEWILDELDRTVDDLPHSSIKKAAEKGNDSTLQLLLDRDYGGWTDEIATGAARSSWRTRRYNPIDDETARRLLQEVDAIRRSKDFVEKVFAGDYSDETKNQAIEQYEGPPFSASSRSLNAEQKVKLIQRGLIDSPARFFNKALRSLKQSDDDADKKGLFDRLDREKQEYILLDAIDRGKSNLVHFAVKQLDPSTDATTAERFLNDNWEHADGDDYRVSWAGDVRDEWLPMTVEDLSLFVTAHHRKVSLFLTLLDEFDRSFDSVPKPVYQQLSREDRGKSRNTVYDVYEQAQKAGDQQYEYVREALSGRPIRNALAGKSVDSDRIDKLLDLGAKPPVDNDRMFEKVLLESDRSELVEAFLEAGSVTASVFYTAVLQLNDEKFELVARNYKPDQSVATRAVNKAIAHPDVDPSRINRLQRLEDIREDFTMDWSHEPTRGSNELKNDPLTFVTGFASRHEDTVDKRETSGIPEKLLLKHLIALGADPMANEQQALRTAIETGRRSLFFTMLDEAEPDLSEHRDLIDRAFEHKQYKIISAFFDYGLDANYNNGEYIKRLVDIHDGTISDDQMNLGERLRELLEAGADPHGEPANEALQVMMEEAFEQNYSKDHDYCYAAKILLTAQKQQGRADLPSVDAVEPYSDTAMFDIICDVLPERRAQGLRSQTRQVVSE